MQWEEKGRDKVGIWLKQKNSRGKYTHAISEEGKLIGQSFKNPDLSFYVAAVSLIKVRQLSELFSGSDNEWLGRVCPVLSEWAFFCAECDPSSTQRVTEHWGIQQQHFFMNQIWITYGSHNHYTHKHKKNDDRCLQWQRKKKQIRCHVMLAFTLGPPFWSRLKYPNNYLMD